MTATPFDSRLSGGSLIVLDGAMGTELDRRGARTYLPLWSAWGLIEAPEVVKAIHVDYARAGADILVTNTFRTTGRMLARAGRDPGDSARLDDLAVRLAKEASEEGGRQALVAGSIAPLEDCYSPWLSPEPEVAFNEHRIQAKQLAEAGADFILVETMPLIAEAEAAALAGLETGLEVVVGFVLGEDDRLLSGETLEDAVAILGQLSVSAIFINCSPVKVVLGALERLRALTDLPLGGYANMGTVEDTVGWAADQSVTGEHYAAGALAWTDAGARVIGGCCGTTPEHIVAIRKLIDAGPIA